MCGQPSHIHGTLFHWAFIFKGQQEISPLDWTNKWLYVSFICVRPRMCLRAHTFASLSRQKCCCCRLPESGTLLIPAGFRTPKRNTGAHIPVDISHGWPQISLFYKPGAFMFWGWGGWWGGVGAGGQEISKHGFFSFPRQNEKHAIYINWNTRNPA